MLNWLLVFAPVAIALEYLAPERHLVVFVAAAIAILPLAAWLGRATEQLADQTGEGVGGLLNATFGNAAELIIALAALRAGLHAMRAFLRGASPAATVEAQPRRQLVAHNSRSLRRTYSSAAGGRPALPRT